MSEDLASQQNFAAPRSGLQWLLAAFDACVQDQKVCDSDAHHKAMGIIEQLLGSVVPTRESDFFLLAGRLKDRSLSPTTRDAIAGNLAKAAPLMISRSERLTTWLSGCSTAVTMLRGLQSDAVDQSDEGLKMLRTAIASISEKPSKSAIEECRRALNELSAARGMLIFAGLMFDDDVSRLDRLAIDSVQESKLFAEGSYSTKH
jgi:hypothetical protein